MVAVNCAEGLRSITPAAVVRRSRAPSSVPSAPAASRRLPRLATRRPPATSGAGGLGLPDPADLRREHPVTPPPGAERVRRRLPEPASSGARQASSIRALYDRDRRRLPRRRRAPRPPNLLPRRAAAPRARARAVRDSSASSDGTATGAPSRAKGHLSCAAARSTAGALTGLAWASASRSRRKVGPSPGWLRSHRYRRPTASSKARRAVPPRVTVGGGAVPGRSPGPAGPARRRRSRCPGRAGSRAGATAGPRRCPESRSGR